MLIQYIVMTASVPMPSSCWGKYGRVAVLEIDLDLGPPPKQISTRARSVRRIVQIWERLHIGTTDRCAFERARARAEELAAALTIGMMSPCR